MEHYWPVFFIVGFLFASGAYAVALRMRVMATVDFVWSAGLGLAVIAYLLCTDSPTLRAYVVTLFIALWSLRLSYHLLSDRILPGVEDPRYQNLSKYWGQSAKRNYYALFLVQIVLVAIFLWPVSIAINAPTAQWLWSDWLGVCIALVALVGESTADRQLASFKADTSNRSGVCRDGFWRYSRHPNYFFEWLHWWAYVAFAFSSTWWWALLGPAVMYLFLRYLTGIPHAERSSLQSRGDAYRRYQQSTNTFFPWKPQKPQS